MSEHLRCTARRCCPCMWYELATRSRLGIQVPGCRQSLYSCRSSVHIVPQRRDVVSALHANNVPGRWVECKSRVHTEFSTRKSNSSITVLPRVVEKIPVMLFVGDQDLICNYVGVESMIQSMTWNGETGLGVSGCGSSE